MITLTSGANEIVMRNAAVLDDEHLYDQSMIVRKNRSGGLLSYRSTDWHDFDTLQLASKSNCSQTFVEDFRIFLDATVGKVITMKIEHTDDAENSIDKTYTGVIITPLIEVVTVGRETALQTREDAVLEYLFNGNALDSSITGSHGTWSGTEAYSSSIRGQAANLTTESSINTNYDPPVHLWPGYTWSAWVKFNDLPAAQAMIMSKRVYIYSLLWNTNQLEFRTREQGLGNGNARWSTFSRIPIVNRWYHIAGAASVGTTDNVKLYVNGELDSVHSHSITQFHEAPLPVVLGKRSNNETLFFNGYLDDFRIHRTALSQLEIQQVMRTQQNTTSMYDVSFEFLIESEA